MSTTKPTRAGSTTADVTLPGGPSGAEGGDMTDGEMTNKTPGSRHSAILNLRENKSLNRNAGPERPSANPGKLPAVTQGQRKTGRI